MHDSSSRWSDGWNFTSQVLGQIIANIHFFDFAVLLLELDEQLFECIIEMLLDAFFGDIVGDGRFIRFLGTILQTEVEILQENRLTERWFIVQFGAVFAMSASANFEEEGTVDFVFFSAEYRRKIISHEFLFDTRDGKRMKRANKK